MMNNKEIQEKRMKEYFIQATKEILKGEGIQSLSVRNIASRAGYSYATMYNYFRDINDLVFLCVNDFQDECQLFVRDKTGKLDGGIERLKASVMAYIHYFVEYPGIFDLFYLARVGDFGNKQTTIDLIGRSLDNICTTEWEYCLNNNIMPAEKAEIIRPLLRNTVTGLLLFYLNRRTPDSYDAFIGKSREQIDYLLTTPDSRKKVE